MSGAMRVTVNSDPPGAEALIDGRTVGTTDVVLSVPYQTSTEQTLVVRREGYANCISKLHPSASDKRVDCSLSKP